MQEGSINEIWCEGVFFGEVEVKRQGAGRCHADLCASCAAARAAYLASLSLTPAASRATSWSAVELSTACALTPINAQSNCEHIAQGV